jgi:hypothetical protein
LKFPIGSNTTTTAAWVVMSWLRHCFPSFAAPTVTLCRLKRIGAGFFGSSKRASSSRSTSSATTQPRGEYRIHLTSRIRRLFGSKVMDTPELEELKQAVVSSLTTWVGKQPSVMRLNSRHMPAENAA